MMKLGKLVEDSSWQEDEEPVVMREVVLNKKIAARYYFVGTG